MFYFYVDATSFFGELFLVVTAVTDNPTCLFFSVIFLFILLQAVTLALPSLFHSILRNLLHNSFDANFSAAGGR